MFNIQVDCDRGTEQSGASYRACAPHRWRRGYPLHPRRRLPKESILVEHIVGLFDRERVGGAGPLPAAEFNAEPRGMAVDNDIQPIPSFTDEQLEAVRAWVEALHNQWAALAPGGTLELAFDRPGP